MTSLSEGNFFFFNSDCSNMEIRPDTLEHAYLSVLTEDLVTAGNIFFKIDSPRAKWGWSFVSILEGFLKDYPTYFQIRNFLEIDLDFLLKNNKIKYVEQFLGALDFLSTINQETYKFTARVMIENGLYSAGLKYMEKSKQIYYNDPELQFMFAKYYMSGHQYESAYYYINECLKLLPEYYPAQVMKQKIEELEN